MFNLLFTNSDTINYLVLLFFSICFVGIPLRIMGVVPAKLRWEAHMVVWMVAIAWSLFLYMTAYNA